MNATPSENPDAQLLGGARAGTPRTSDRSFAEEAVQAEPPLVFELDDHTLGFYTGRGLTGPSPVRHVEGAVPYGAESEGTNWVDFGSWDLGICNYVLHRGATAIVYDTGNLRATAGWIRRYLESMEIAHFVVVLSHWHLDHIVGNPIYRDSVIMSLKETRDTLVRLKSAIEEGRLWGPPSFEVVLPNATFERGFEIHLEDLRVQFMHVNIHSADGNVMYVESDETLFAGDTLEDTVTVVGQPEAIPVHIEQLAQLRQLAAERILPNHGDPEVIKRGGYGKSLIDAVEEYDRNMLTKVHDDGYLRLPVEAFIPRALANSSVSLIEPYEVVHQRNLRIVHECWKEKAVPTAIS